MSAPQQEPPQVRQRLPAEDARFGRGSQQVPKPLLRVVPTALLYAQLVQVRLEGEAVRPQVGLAGPGEAGIREAERVGVASEPARRLHQRGVAEGGELALP